MEKGNEAWKHIKLLRFYIAHYIYGVVAINSVYVMSYVKTELFYAFSSFVFLLHVYSLEISRHKWLKLLLSFKVYFLWIIWIVFSNHMPFFWFNYYFDYRKIYRLYRIRVLRYLKLLRLDANILRLTSYGMQCNQWWTSH